MSDYVLEGPKWGAATYGTPGGTVTWAVDSTVPASFLAVLSAAFADWSAHANVQFTQVATTSQSQIDFDVAAIDGPSNVLGVTNYGFSGRSMLSAAVTFDSGEGWHASGGKVTSSTGIDLFLVALHEIGHALGLDHYNTAPAVMGATVNRGVSDLTTSDIDGIQALYGAPVTLAVVLGTTATTGTTASASPAEVYRFYDTKTGDHFYTLSAAEKAQVQASLPTFQYEGAAWSTPDKGAGTTDVFRFFDTVTGTHFFTTSTTERDAIVANLKTFTYEGVAFQAYASEGAAGTFALERFYNTATGQHHFATQAEADGIRHGSAGANWVDEGKGFVVHAPPGDILTS